MGEELTSLDVLLRLTVAMVCGGVIGWERGWSNHSAGLRTQILVAIGSAGFVIISLRWQPNQTGEGLYQLDPFRVLQGIIGGVGLIAGGAIIYGKSSVRGLTTASAVWAVTAIGTACGFGQFDLAGILTVMTLFVTGLLVYIDPKEHEEKKELEDARSGLRSPEELPPE